MQHLAHSATHISQDILDPLAELWTTSSGKGVRHGE